MKKTIFVFGVISGLISSVLMLATLPFAHRIGFDRSMLVGYTVIVASMLLVFFGIKSYRDNHGGHISFGKGFAIGIAITLISCVFYVVTWEVMYFKFMPNFVDDYGAYLIQKMQASGATQAAIQSKIEEMKHLKAMYNDPLTNAAMTFIEPLPVGLGITLISALLLRRKQQAA